MVGPVLALLSLTKAHSSTVCLQIWLNLHLEDSCRQSHCKLIWNPFQIHPNSFHFSSSPCQCLVQFASPGNSRITIDLVHAVSGILVQYVSDGLLFECNKLHTTKHSLDCHRPVYAWIFEMPLHICHSFLNQSQLRPLQDMLSASSLSVASGIAGPEGRGTKGSWVSGSWRCWRCFHCRWNASKALHLLAVFRQDIVSQSLFQISRADFQWATATIATPKFKYHPTP